ncbi:MAG: AMP-binding protein [Gammaproteobacteria bacterium]|nr:AMP-binding protein [Gammaproteobacteria bacterium]
MDWYRKRTLSDVMDEAAARWGAREALVFGEQRWTYAQLNEEVNRAAKALIALGVQNGEHVALWMTNRPEWLFLMFGVARVGGCLVPLNTRYRTDDVAYAVRQSRSRTLISLDRSGPIDYQGMLAETMPSIERHSDGRLLVDGYPDLERLVILGERSLAHAQDWQQFMAGGARISDAELAARKTAVDPDGRMVICYTSGTTGSPKGVVHSHRPIRNTHERAQMLGMTMHDVHMNYLPLFHLYAYAEITLAAALVGAKQVMMDVFDAERVLDLAEQEKATVLHGFEAHWLDLLNAQARKPRDIRMRIGTLPSGVESTVPIAEKVQDVFGPTVSGFGMSEIWAYVSCDNPSSTREQRVHASGYPMNDYEFRVIDVETGADQPDNVPGELLVRGYTVMDCYWDKPEATADAKDKDGWLHTGDMGMRRPDGWMVFMGRYKDMLKVGGENVSPAEVEAYLRNMAEVRDAAVVAYPDARLAEVPVAFVIKEPGHDIEAQALIDRMHGRIASFKIPRHVIFVEGYPMTSSGKIRKVELRAEARRILG